MVKEHKISETLIKEILEQAYAKFKDNADGANANYIPYLANIDSKLFGIAICLPNGKVLEVGDTNYAFGIESVSKVPTALLVINDYGPDKVEEMIGADATGLPFNSIFALLLENDHPSTPLVNAGAIAACSLVRPQGYKAGKWKAIVDNIMALCGSAPVLIEDLYKSESDTYFTNLAISWLLHNYNRLYDVPLMSLVLYIKQSFLGITAF